MKYDIAIAFPLLFVVNALLVNHHAIGQTKTVPMTVIRNGVPVTVMRTINQGTNNTVQLDSTGRPVTTAPNATPPANQPGQTVEQLRLQKLLALQFNRTGTAYLQQWSAANLPEPVEDETNKGEGKANQENQSQDVPSNSKQWQPSDLPPSPLVKAKPITPEQTKEIEKEVKRFEQNVVLAEWDQVQKYMTGLPKEDAKKLHAHMIARLSISNSQVMTASSEMTPEQQMAMQVKQQANSAGIREATLVSADDVLGLIRCAPGEIDEQQLKSLSQILSIVKSKQHEIEDFVAALDKGVGGIGGKEPAKRELVATLLLSARLSKSAQPFLPPLENAIKEKNLKHVQLHLMYVEQSYALEKKPEQLEQNWRLIQFLLAQDSLKVAERRSLLQKAVTNASRIRKELGDQWLEDSFTKDPDRGLQIVANLGATVSQNFVSRYQSPHARIDSLKLQNNAVESLIRVAPVLAKKWQPALNVLVDNWIQEAETAIRYYYDHNSRPRMQLDMYGNYYWASQNQNQYYGNQRRPRPITPTELLRLRPSDQWQSLILESRRNRFNSVLAQLYLKNEQENEAFPYIERVAQRDPKQARSLANEFMQAWTRSHDPNSARRNRNPYIYVYGYDTKADAIPLTRSKQERNLAELKIWIEKIRALPIEPLDEKVLARAFTTSHSQAEVYKIEAFENVFGSIDSLKPETIASIGHTMRENLGGKWRQVQLQEATKTKRKEPEVQQEVIEGYIAALNIVEQSLAKHPENWQLMLAKACLYFEQNAYHGTIAKSSTFTEERDKAFAMFKNAASLYEQRVPELEEKDHKVEIYQRWFYASLGACDVRRITHETVPDSRQHAMIRAALDQLPGDLAEKHLAKFANDLFTRMSPLKPQVKFRYLDGGFAIVGDHPRAAEAQKVYQYYRDLVTEIKLEIQIDGSDNVGHTQPFGLFVNLIHTPEIERESGGFAKYVQNQNQANYAYNYGRPTEDYRDKFEEETAKALSEHFEVLSVIFENPKSMKSRELNEGWRVTPYAYVLLKPRGAHVDRIPPIKIDFDFLDTSGYAILPIQSQTIPISCNEKDGDARPVSSLEVTQTLDERRASEGKLILEVKASATGIVPALDQVIETRVPGFEIVSIDDQTVVPSKFDDTSNAIQVKSDRSWTIEMEATHVNNIEEFEFPLANDRVSKSTYQRYDDADLVQVSRVVTLEKDYAKSQPWWVRLLPLVIGIPILLLLVAIVILLVKRKPVDSRQFRMPEEINPFTVIGLLRSINENGDVRDRDRNELQQSIHRLEQHYFGQTNGDSAPDLEKLALNWLRKT